MEYIYTDYKNFEPCKIEFKRHKGKNEKYTAENFLALDTETSHLKDYSEAWMYQWCFSYPTNNKNVRLLVYGRKPYELALTLFKIKGTLGVDEEHKLPIYIHNLSYDYAYIKDYLEKIWEEKGTVLAVGNHKLISYEIDGLVFKCSYKLSLKSLDGWCKELGTKHRKLKGTIDYDKIRYQDSPLTRKDWKYMFYDIICLDEAIFKQLEKWNDDLITIPLTNTGYVRREARKAFKKDKKNRDNFLKKKLDYDTYNMLKKEFAGGLTHGNRFYADYTINIDVINEKLGRNDYMIKHRDFASHYPSQQMCYGAPTSKFTLYMERTEENPITKEMVFELCKKRCVLINMVVKELELDESVTLPYAQVSKFKEGAIGNIKYIEDNGRILKLESGYSVITLNEYDFKWMVKQYKKFKFEVLSVYTASKGRFPKYLTDTVKEFFYQKSYYKAEEKRLEAEGVSEDDPIYIENHLNLMIAKGMLNAIYGMSATDPVRTSYYEKEDGEWDKEELTIENIVDKLEKFYENKNSFMNYELGCWTTSLARNELLTFVEIVGYENFLYADTDSIFYLSTPEIEAKIEAKNEEFRKIDEEQGWYVEVNGEKTYFNQFELEKEEITKFKFLRAKCYAYIVKKDNKEELKTTIAGVKKHGRNNNTRVKELGNIENLKSQYVFKDCGGTVIKHLNRRPEEININGHLTQISSAAIITPTDKTLHSMEEIGEDTMFFWEAGAIE